MADRAELLRLAVGPYDEAFRCFERWRAEHDPDEKLDICEAAAEYARWADENGIEKYLDAAQGASDDR